MEITVGMKVRSFDHAGTHDGTRYGRDLEGERASYIEGTVTAIEPAGERWGCERYKILVDRDVYPRREQTQGRVDTYVYPPVNGTPTQFGNICDSVEVI